MPTCTRCKTSNFTNSLMNKNLMKDIRHTVFASPMGQSIKVSVPDSWCSNALCLCDYIQIISTQTQMCL